MSTMIKNQLVNLFSNDDDVDLAKAALALRVYGGLQAQRPCARFYGLHAWRFKANGLAKGPIL